MFQLVGEITGIIERHRHGRERGALAGDIQFRSHQLGALDADLHGGIALAFQPVAQHIDLGGAAGAIRTLDDDQFAFQAVRIQVGDAFSIKLFGHGTFHSYLYRARSIFF